MNAGLTIATILSLLMALAGGGSADVAKKKSADEQQLETNKQGTNGGIFGLGIGTTNSPSGQNLNHNETLVRDTEYMISIGGICSPMICGANHNETIVRDTAPSQQSDSSGVWLTGEQAFAASLLSMFLTYRIGGCSPQVCGANHNETLVRDVALMQ